MIDFEINGFEMKTSNASELRIPLRSLHHLLRLRLSLPMQFLVTSAALLLHHVIHMTQNQREMAGSIILLFNKTQR